MKCYGGHLSQCVVSNQKSCLNLSIYLQEIKLEEFQAIYQSKNKNSIDYTTYGFESLADLLSRMQETIIVRQNSQGCFTVIPRNAPNPNSSSNARHGIPEEIIKKMKQLISNYPEGIQAHEFLSMFKVWSYIFLNTWYSNKAW